MFLKFINFCTYAQAVDSSRGIRSNSKEAMSGLPGPEKQKKAKFSHKHCLLSSFKKGQIFKQEKGQISSKICLIISNKFWNFLKCSMYC